MKLSSVILKIAYQKERISVEHDSITARVLRLLHPNAKFFEQGFEETAPPNDYFDPILGNTPYRHAG